MKTFIVRRYRRLFILGCLLVSVISVDGRTLYDFNEITTPVRKMAEGVPYVDIGIHDIGKLGLTISNNGSFGTGFLGPYIDETTGLPAPSGVYPYPGNMKYLFAGCF